MKSIRRILVRFSVTLGCTWASLLIAAQTDQSGIAGRVDVILWFDTEDYLLPASDDAAQRVAEMLSARGIRATFKVVGEKARTLERRGRRDVIAALKKHDIGYHSNFHSVHPTPTEYLADCGLLDGISEFARREGGGAADVRRIFGVPTLACYGQPGSSWAAQAIAALGQIGVAPERTPCYVDEGSQVGLDEKPFWYAGALNVFHMGANYTRMDLHDSSALEPAKAKVSQITERLRAEGGGLISIFYHPCEWVHREFWDGVNFAHGRNPPREEWKPPPQRPAAETEAAFERFGKYIDHIRSLPGVKFVTASDLPKTYPDPVRTKGVSEEELGELAQRIVRSSTNGIDFQIVGQKAFSAADQFELLTESVASIVANKRVTFPITATGLLGPDSSPFESPDESIPGHKIEGRNLSWVSFRDTVWDVRDFIQTQHRVPARVFIGADATAPADFLLTLASVYLQHRTGTGHADVVQIQRGTKIVSARYVAEDAPGLFGWVIHKQGFHAPKVMEVARLQAWTLKPALRAQ